METKIGQPVRLSISDTHPLKTEPAKSTRISNTLFAIPKDFVGHTGLIQRNAIRSWMRLGSNVDVILLGDAAGIKEAASETGATHIPGVSCNEHGTPLISSAFKLAQGQAKSDYLTYVNSDIILLKDFQRSIERIINYGMKQFLAIGRRIDLEISSEFSFDNLHQVETILNNVQQFGRQAPLVCKDFFVFHKSMFNEMPPFAVGRGNWDNWVVHSANRNNTPVIDLSQCATIIHQNHDYAHMHNGGRKAAYVTGDEAKQNETLAGGKHIVSGCASTYCLTPTHLKRRSMSGLNIPFWTDIPNFLRLLRNLFFGRNSKSTAPS